MKLHVSLEFISLEKHLRCLYTLGKYRKTIAKVQLLKVKQDRSRFMLSPDIPS